MSSFGHEFPQFHHSNKRASAVLPEGIYEACYVITPPNSQFEFDNISNPASFFFNVNLVLLREKPKELTALLPCCSDCFLWTNFTLDAPDEAPRCRKLSAICKMSYSTHLCLRISTS